MTHPRRSLCTPSAGTGGRTCPGGLHPLLLRRRLCRCPGRSEGTPRGGDTHRNRSRPARRRRPPHPCGTGRGGERGHRPPPPARAAPCPLAFVPASRQPHPAPPARRHPPQGPAKARRPVRAAREPGEAGRSRYTRGERQLPRGCRRRRLRRGEGHTHTYAGRDRAQGPPLLGERPAVVLLGPHLGSSNSTKAKGGPPRRFLRSMSRMAPYL